MNQMSSTSSANRKQLQQKRPLWRNRDFLLLWSGQTISLLGTNISTLALPLLILALTRSPAQAGLLAASRMLPYLLFSLPVGALIDRWDRKAVMIRCDLLRWLALGSIPLAFVFGLLSVPQLYIVAFIEGSANVLFSLAQISALPRVVASEQLAQAYALDQISESSATLLGPGLSGLIISLARTTTIGAVIAYLADSLSYLASVLSLRFMRVPFQSERSHEDRQSILAAIREGQRFLWQQPLLRTMVLLTTAINFLQAAIPLALIILLQSQFHASPAIIGLVFSVGGVGGLIGGALAPWMEKRLRFGQVVLGSLLLWVIAAALLATSLSLPTVLLGTFLVNFTWMPYGVTLVSYRLSLVPDELQGRVNSSFRVFSYGSEPLGAAVGGLLLAALSARGELWAIAIGLALCTLSITFTRLRNV